MRFEYSASKGSCSLTHNFTTGKAERALENLALLDPSDPQRNELRVAREAAGSLAGTLRESADDGSPLKRCPEYTADPEGT